MTETTDELEAQIRERLDEVLDPCSTFTARPHSIIDLGLVDGVRIDGRDVTVDLLPTNQLCMYIPHMTDEIETRLRRLPAVDSITVEVVADEVWTRDRMTTATKREREAHFQSRVVEHDLTPAYDGDSWSGDLISELSEGNNG